MSEVRIGDIAPINSVKNSDKIPISVGDSQAHTVEISTLKTFINQGTLVAVDWNEIQGKPTFSAVATTGSYNDLTNQPTIVSPNDLNDVEKKIPTATSQIVNDSGFIEDYKVVELKEENLVIDKIEDNTYYKTGIGGLKSLSIIKSNKLNRAVIEVINIGQAPKVELSNGGSYVINPNSTDLNNLPIGKILFIFFKDNIIILANQNNK